MCADALESRPPLRDDGLESCCLFRFIVVVVRVILLVVEVAIVVFLVVVCCCYNLWSEYGSTLQVS